MFCSKCGKENNNDSNFCVHCGEKFKDNSQQNSIKEDKLEIRQDTNGNVLYIIGALIFVVAGLWLTFMKYTTFIDFSPLQSKLIFYVFKVVGIISVLYFGYICIYLIKRSSDNRPLVIVNKEGIYDNSSATAVGFIPWSNIENMYIKTSVGNKFIQINLKNKIKNRDCVYITLYSTGIDPENFLQQMLEYRKCNIR